MVRPFVRLRAGLLMKKIINEGRLLPSLAEGSPRTEMVNVPVMETHYKKFLIAHHDQRIIQL